jgi:hypothetical protein
MIGCSPSTVNNIRAVLASDDTVVQEAVASGQMSSKAGASAPPSGPHSGTTTDGSRWMRPAPE